MLRIDSYSQSSMAKMLRNARCDVAVMNDFNATAIFVANDFCNLTVYQSPITTNKVDLVFVMRSDLRALLQVINQQIQVFIDSGAMAKSLLRHSSDMTFPRFQRCQQEPS